MDTKNAGTSTAGSLPVHVQLKSKKRGPLPSTHDIFMGDRTDRGDPTPFAMSPDKEKECGTWRKVMWDDKVEAQATFFEDEKNLSKLYSPKEDVTLKEEDAPLTILVGLKTAEYVLKANPSPAQL